METEVVFQVRKLLAVEEKKNLRTTFEENEGIVVFVLG